MICLTYILFCIFFAWLNSRWIKNGAGIKHGINGAIHLVAAAAYGYFYHWHYFFLVLLITRLFFDVALNLFRGLPVDYVAMQPRSIVDKVEKKIFGNDGWLPKLIYFFLIGILIWV